MRTIDDRLAAIRARLDETQSALRDGTDVVIDGGLEYAQHDPVRVWIRKRGRRFDLADDATAVARAGRPTGWLKVSDRVVAEQGFNINRRGVIFVPAVEGRDIAALVCRLAEISRSVYLTLLEY